MEPVDWGTHWVVESQPYFSSPVVFMGSCTVLGCDYRTGKWVTLPGARRALINHLSDKHGIHYEKEKT